MEDEQTRRQKGTLNKMKKNCKNCKKATWPNLALRSYMVAFIAIHVTSGEFSHFKHPKYRFIYKFCRSVEILLPNF